MNGRMPSVARCCLFAVCLASGGPFAAGQIQLQIGHPLQPAIVPLMPPGDTASSAIGDPWWDDSASRPQAGTPADEPADRELLGEEVGEIEEDADPQAHLRAQAELVREGLRQRGLATLRRELSLVRQVCPSLERQQRALVLQAGRQAIERVVDDQIAAIGRRRGRQADMEEAIGEALRASVAANAAADESAAYEAERGHRQARAKRAVVAAIVEDVDRDAWLEEVERVALSKVLSESYRARWRPAIMRLQQGASTEVDPIMPGVERCVEKALGKERQAQWLERREESRMLAEAAGAEHMPMNGGIGIGTIQVEALDPADGPAVRRVIRHRVGVDGARMQLRIRVGGVVVEDGAGGHESDEGGPAAEKEK